MSGASMFVRNAQIDDPSLLEPFCAEPITPERLEECLGFETHFFERFNMVFIHKDVSETLGVSGYDRLEFLGDSVINFVCAKFLLDKYPDSDEGFLTKSRSKLVCTKSLAQMSARLGLPRHVVMTKGAFEAGSNNLPSIAEDLFEALVGCIYETHGLLEAKRFFLDRLEEEYASDEFGILFRDDNCKDAAMRYCHSIGLPPPTYHVVPPLVPPGPDSPPSYKSCIMFGGRQMGFGEAPTKKAAEQMAAKSALASLGLLDASGFVNNSLIRKKQRVQRISA
jgi:ribonuclease-3